MYSGVVSQSGRQVVLKRVSSDDLERTRREIQAHRRYDHPNLMPLLDSCVSGSVAWMVFPLCADGSLRDAIDAKVVESAAPPWSPADFSKLFEGTCRGLAAMHASGFAHRDIKPENVLIAEGCRPVLMDFGSVAEAKVSVETRRETLVLQDEAAAHSTMPYRAPELWQPEVCPGGGVIDTAKSDVWALGCLLWAMAYGYSPFESDFPSGSKTPRIVPPSHLRTLAKPGLPPKDALGTRHEPEFFARVLSSSLELLVVDHNERPDIHRALDLAVSLSTGPL